MTEREKIHSGNIYWPSDPTIMEEQLAYLDLMDEYNNTPRRLQEQRTAMLPKLFAEVGEDCRRDRGFGCSTLVYGKKPS